MKKTFAVLFSIFLFVSFFSLPNNARGIGINEQPYCSELSAEEKTGGMVPCGRDCDDPNTETDETVTCTFCHFLTMINGLAKTIIFYFVPSIAVIMLIVGGIMFLFAGANSGLMAKAKGIITGVAIGIVVIFTAWVLVNTALTEMGIIDTPSILEWYNVSCEIK
jgi:amino acid transporter